MVYLNKMNGRGSTKIGRYLHTKYIGDCARLFRIVYSYAFFVSLWFNHVRYVMNTELIAQDNIDIILSTDLVAHKCYCRFSGLCRVFQ